MKGARALKAGDIAESIWVKGDTYRLEKAKGKTESDLFTYYAEIERVVDGDTIIAQVDLGFGVTTLLPPFKSSNTTSLFSSSLHFRFGICCPFHARWFLYYPRSNYIRGLAGSECNEQYI